MLQEPNDVTTNTTTNLHGLNPGQSFSRGGMGGGK